MFESYINYQQEPRENKCRFGQSYTCNNLCTNALGFCKTHLELIRLAYRKDQPLHVRMHSELNLVCPKCKQATLQYKQHYSALQGITIFYQTKGCCKQRLHINQEILDLIYRELQDDMSIYQHELNSILRNLNAEQIALFKKLTKQ